MTTEYCAIPRHFSRVPDDVDISAAHLGAKTLGLPLLPQGEQVARLLEARTDEDGLTVPLYTRVVIQVPRRSTKTTSISAVILGRCLTIPNYRVISTAQDGSRASTALKEVMWMLQKADPDSTLWTLRWSNGGEHILFSNGSVWERRPPKSDTFRGAAADCFLFDEAGALPVEAAEDLVQGALPLMDTRPLGQIIISGTPGKERAGLLWDSLEAARLGEEGVGSLDYGMDQTDDPADEAVWYRCHPGLASGLTRIKVLRQRFALMSLPAFMVEYLGWFAQSSFVRAVDPEAWDKCKDITPAKPGRDDRFTFSVDVSPDAGSSCITMAWRDAAGVARIALVDHRPGTDWLPKAMNELLLKYPKTRMVYDEIGAVREPVLVLLRNRKITSRVTPALKKDVQAGQAGLVRMIHANEVFHHDQAGLNVAIDGLQWRTSAEYGQWFGWSASKVDISPVRAAALAMWDYDQKANKKAIIL